MNYTPVLKEELADIAKDMRLDILKMVHTCGKQNGHLGGCMSAVETLAVLYTQVMNINKVAHSDLSWSERDRFIMSKGHAGIAMYAAMKHVGLISQEMINGSIRGDNTVLYRHPKRNTEYGIECSVGSLGMGIGYAIGLAESFKRIRTSQKVFVMIGDGECDEGSVWEGAAYAGHRGLSNLIVIIDKNGLQLDGPTRDIVSMDNMSERWSAFGFTTVDVDGHSMNALIEAFKTPHDGKPLAIIAHTVKGKGMSFAENKVEWHDNYLSDELYEKGVKELGDPDLSAVRNRAEERFKYKKINVVEVVCGKNIKLEESKEIIQDWNSYGSKNIVGEASYLLAEQDDKFTLIYSDCANRIGIKKLQEKHPEKCFEVGIAEQNQICMAAAMAHEGFHVFAVAYAPFITARALDQIRANLAYMKAPVCLIGLGAGLASSDLGATHTAFEDIANLRGLPNLSVLTPVDTYEITKGMEWFVNRPEPMYLRITMNSPDRMIYHTPVEYKPFRFDVVREGESALVIATGSVIGEVLEAAKILNESGISLEVINIRSIKPLNKAIRDEIAKFTKVIAIEEHSIVGGLYSAITELICNKEEKLFKIGIRDEYFIADEPSSLRRITGLDAEGISETIYRYIMLDEGVE